MNRNEGGLIWWTDCECGMRHLFIRTWSGTYVAVSHYGWGVFWRVALGWFRLGVEKLLGRSVW